MAVASSPPSAPCPSSRASTIAWTRSSLRRARSSSVRWYAAAAAPDCWSIVSQVRVACRISAGTFSGSCRPTTSTTASQNTRPASR
ncbi:hypothetical protein [Actinomadura madurae]|uniref:hypothetical protein n=1 Tax=Actinomadura madurae TaxID=1993 RepID=UPI0020D245D9|nr:hypothetical protein [Actinomadura madurae]MCP9953497.1 hypothetical protein [Actinomadura madurae]MCP9982726.1 hypothetical protein [Actinomadura madurae]MCQ0005723.1 hypothetical protein [Actinomadura madurae]MCQ0018961.1 hypothetical protein [Actinomadura madurae]